MVADCLNYGLKVSEAAKDTKVLTRMEKGIATLNAVTGPNYGRIWNADVVKALMERFGDGVTGQFRVPGIWGKPLSEVTNQNTTLYAGERDMFIFLADESRPIEMANRRDGQSGQLNRGFFVWNSEVGSCTLGIMSFIYDTVCANRIVWGASQIEEIRIRHTISAPDRFIEEVVPALQEYSESSDSGIKLAIENAKALNMDEERVSEFLEGRFGKGLVNAIQEAHVQDEGRPIENMWDVVTGATAYARQVKFQPERLEIEREAGRILQAA